MPTLVSKGDSIAGDATCTVATPRHVGGTHPIDTGRPPAAVIRPENFHRVIWRVCRGAAQVLCLQETALHVAPIQLGYSIRRPRGLRGRETLPWP